MDNQEILEYIKKSFELKTQGFYKPAIEMLYKALNIAPDNIEILEQLAHLYKLLGETDRAIYYIEKVLEVQPNHSDALILLSDIYIEKKEFEQALELSEKLCEILPENVNFLKKIVVLKSLNRTDDVYNFFGTIQNPDENILYEIAELASKNNDLDKAKDLLEQSRTINFKNEKVSELLAKIYYKQKNIAASKEILLELSKKTNNPEVFNYLGLIEADSDNHEKAVEYFEKASSIDEQNPEYIFNKASSYFLLGWTDEAIQSFKKAICLAPMNSDYHYSLAFLYYQQNKYQASMGEVQAVRDITSEHQMSNILYSMILAKQGNLLEAKRNLDSIKDKNPNDDFTYYALFSVNNDMLNIDEAKKCIEKAIELNPSSINYMSEYLEFLLKREEFGKAEDIAKKILEINKKFLQAHVALAQIYMEKHDYDNMYEEAQNIIELDSNCPQGYYYNSIAVFEQGDNIFAIECLKKAISLDLNNAMLYLKMSEFYQDMHDLEAAYDWALEAAEIDERNYNYRWLCAKIARSLHREDDALRNYSHCYRFAAKDTDLCNDYAEFLKSVGRDEQAKRVLASR